MTSTHTIDVARILGAVEENWGKVPFDGPVPDDWAEMSWGFRTVRPDFSSSHGYTWPFPGQWAEADGDTFTRGDPCPDRPGDGICVARTWAGMASGGQPVSTLLIVGWRAGDMLGEAPEKVRVSRAYVAAALDLRALGAKGVLRSANLRSANLRYANLHSANLRSANLRYTNLGSADLGSANLHSANLRSANLRYTNLGSADLRYADLRYTLGLYWAIGLTSARGNQFTMLPDGWKIDEATGLVATDAEVKG